MQTFIIPVYPLQAVLTFLGLPVFNQELMMFVTTGPYGKNFTITLVRHVAEFSPFLIHYQFRVMARKANSKPLLLIPGKEEGINSLLGVSSDSIAISGGEMQEDSLYQKPSLSA